MNSKILIEKNEIMILNLIFNGDRAIKSLIWCGVFLRIETKNQR